jgi:hypothetical protein
VETKEEYSTAKCWNVTVRREKRPEEYLFNKENPVVNTNPIAKLRANARKI